MLPLSPRKGFWVSTGDLMGAPKSNIGEVSRHL
jgi:hypothetical protein